ncbi:AraC family transcriptional regulator [Opitutaceae bacterium TAV4]|nr:AraC family transcriptional regulator [Opitutaceae bacterium TAV4]
MSSQTSFMRDEKGFEETRERALLALGVRIFQNPRLLVQAYWHRMKDKILVPPHDHSDMLQLDLNIGMSGVITIEEETIPIQGVTAAAFYPGQRHSIELEPAAPQAWIFSIKIRVSPQWEAVRERIFHPYLKLLFADHHLVKMLRQLNRVGTVESSRQTLMCVTLADVLCHWPGASSGTTSHTLQTGPDGEIGTGMQNALHLIEENLSNPPSQQQLAASSHMSTRNFTRHFRQLFGCAPHAYITARRLACARELLAHKARNITEIADELGFPSIHAFSRWFQRIEGTSPSVYREKHFLL